MLIFCILLSASIACAKTGRTHYDDELMARVRDKIARHDWAKAQVDGAKNSCKRWLEMSDEELWDFVPPPEQLRALNVHFGKGCPKCGKEIFRKGGHYPWIMSSDKPFKVKCPVCGTEFPGNDFQPWNLNALTEEPQKGPGYVDNGAGWEDDDGTRYFFVGTYIFWHRWQREVFPAVSSLAQAYLLSDEPQYAHKCAVLLAGIAEKYDRYDYPTQAYHNGRWPAGINGRILDYIWSTGVTGNLATSYDAIYPALDTEPQLLAFLKTKGCEDPHALFEDKLLKIMAEDIMRGFVVGNMGMHQRALCQVAIVWDNEDPEKGPTTAQMRDWIMTGTGTTEYLLWNGFYRDGHGGESSPGYSSGWCSNFYTVADLLPKLGVDIWSIPKVKKMADIGLDMVITGVFTPCIGDSGTIFGSKRLGWNAAMLGRAFTHYKDPRFAKALAMIGARSQQLFDEYYDQEQVDKVVAEIGEDSEFRTRNLGGYGLAILESEQKDNPRGVSMYYGFAGGGHGHYDRLTMEMIAHDRPVLTDMGYPAHWLPKNAYWTANTISHYCVVVDQHKQESMNRGYLNTLAASPQVQLMDASAEKAVYPNTCSLYRRTAALIDISPETSYLLDIFRVRGGYQHDYSFHGPPFPEFTVAGATPGPLQKKGTVMGEEVEFAGTPTAQTELQSGGIAIPLRKTEDVINDSANYGERSKEGWCTYSGGNTILTTKTHTLMTVKFPQVPAGKYKLFINVHDYNSGEVVLEVSVGDVTKTMSYEASGKVGARWISEIFELNSPADKFSMMVTELGQPYALIYNAILTPNLAATTPQTADIRSSGFQYLFNVRRMKPDSTWSATWRKPDEDLALTMTMPAGCADEIILADAEAELKPQHPDTLQYVLARNLLADDAGTEAALSSTYIAVAEPHKGPAGITAVDRLKAVKATADAAGVSVAYAGHTDLIHSSIEPSEEATWQAGNAQLTATAEFAMVTIDGTGITRACMVNGTQLRCGDFVLSTPPSPTGKVLSVDHEHNSIIIEGELGLPEAFADRVVILGNELQQTSYTIKAITVADGNTTLAFGDTLFLIQMGYVEASDSRKNTVTLAKLGRVDGRQHQGRWLYNEDKSVGFRIATCSGSTFGLEGVEGELDEIFVDFDGDGRRLYWVSDIGPGDTYRIPTVTYVERESPHLYRVRTMTNAELTIPPAEVIVDKP